ncbi:GDSL-like Lipase/Acylhydrolase [Chitinophaga sp. CF118]|uniref:GDSL-type esterase/lipase family protein n=1 Tax=Chitinophaga sp. CF118 TaxID=1884367 RepID=UPI0008E5972C|nr:GDSL-type esterase/lipase family protein [Chitinophaga sp. CF118]SFE30797.1 GDSL-like Lipase/Acylhydrolase [Chitinophaga sp. CF118]
MNISSWNISRSFFTGLLAITGSIATAQNNTIAQDTALNRFYAALRHSDSNVISILHIGDSHVQAGFFPLTTANYLQKTFGSAGRGWVFPFNLAGTNGPEDYRWNSTCRWDAARVVDRYKNDPLGPGAIVITSQSGAPTIAYSGKQDGIDNSIREAELFYDAGLEDGRIAVPGAEVVVSGIPFPGAGETVRKATLTFPDAVQSFQARWEEKGNNPFRFYGAMIRNGKNGVLYSAIGINGAMYQHYNEQSSILTAQMAVMQPQLVIISLGTNEAYSSLNAHAFRMQIDSTVQLIKRTHPEASIVLTTPAESKRISKRAFRKKSGKKYRTYYKIAYYPNPYVTVVTQQIMNYCRENGLACWNFNGLTRSMAGSFSGTWAADHIHFGARGYQLQGKLLYEALNEGYLKYLKEAKITQ